MPAGVRGGEAAPSLVLPHVLQPFRLCSAGRGESRATPAARRSEAPGNGVTTKISFVSYTGIPTSWVSEGKWSRM